MEEPDKVKLCTVREAAQPEGRIKGTKKDVRWESQSSVMTGTEINEMNKCHKVDFETKFKDGFRWNQSELFNNLESCSFILINM